MSKNLQSICLLAQVACTKDTHTVMPIKSYPWYNTHLALGGNKYTPLGLCRRNTRNTPPPALAFLLWKPTRMSPSVKPVNPTKRFDIARACTFVCVSSEHVCMSRFVKMNWHGGIYEVLCILKHRPWGREDSSNASWSACCFPFRCDLPFLDPEDICKLNSFWSITNEVFKTSSTRIIMPVTNYRCVYALNRILCKPANCH